MAAARNLPPDEVVYGTYCRERDRKPRGALRCTGEYYGKSDEWARLLVRRYEQARRGVDLAYIPPPDAYPTPVPVCQDELLLCQLLANEPPQTCHIQVVTPSSPALPMASPVAKSPFIYLQSLNPLDNAKYTADLSLLFLLFALVVVFIAALKSG